MSATFKNAKKKLSQSELRKFMHEHKEKTQKIAVKKIDSPLAKYNEAGQLTCVLCKSVVRSEAVWPIHLNAKQHRLNVEQAKRLKEKTNNFTTALKRPLTPPLDVPSKKVKGILKNSEPSKTVIKSNITVVAGDVETKKGLPSDFFDNNKKVEVTKKEEEQMEVDAESLPEGFFDDPKLDAKARNIEYKDPVEEEWDKFQREMKDANHESAAIIAEDQEEATNERQIDEIDEQLRYLSRVVNLQKKKDQMMASLKENESRMDEKSAESSSSDEDFDEYLDWRSKKAYK
ncbi:PREDICTED: zinc finger protein 830 [Nicrophorus vespilloides]|uniref:Zinc finger protein 830 n=1 Tax=Nicrophorus vespilloides TaxID=110193 RepID=A0ABM1N2N4_NICVS|nr:PREDICTED: zinc finger protein 830 [Nicrophorus vespilloides]